MGQNLKIYDVIYGFGKHLCNLFLAVKISKAPKLWASIRQTRVGCSYFQ